MLAAAAGMLALVPAAGATVSVEPSRAAPGTTVVIVFAVANEHDTADLTEISVGVPPGTTFAPIPVSAWQSAVTGRTLTWTGRLQPGAPVALPVVTTLPNRRARIVFGVLERFADGKTARYHPTLVLAGGGGGSTRTIAWIALVLGIGAIALAAIAVAYTDARFRKASGRQW